MAPRLRSDTNSDTTSTMLAASLIFSTVALSIIVFTIPGRALAAPVSIVANLEIFFENGRCYGDKYYNKNVKGRNPHESCALI